MIGAMMAAPAFLLRALTTRAVALPELARPPLDATAWGVLVGGVLLISLVLWYFFGEREGTRAEPAVSGVQEVRVTVRGGYSPDRIVVQQGRPVRLDFYRDETASCSDTLVMGEFGISRPLPAYQTTSVEFTPEQAGTFPFTCGMRMLRGTLVVEPR